MRTFNYSRLCVLLSGACALLLNHKIQAQEKPAVLPAQAFYQLPAIRNIRISPDGTHLIALKNMGSDTAVMTLNLATGETFYPTKTDNKELKINWIDWGNNDRIILSAKFDTYQQGTNIHYSQTRLLAMDAKKNSEMIRLIKPVDTSQFGGGDYMRESQFQDNVIGRIPSEPDRILVAVDRELPNHPGVYKIDVNKVDSKKVQAEKGDVVDWIADQQGVVRVGKTFNDRDRKVGYRVLDPKTNEWVRMWEYVIFESPAITPVGFGKDATELYLFADHEGREALYKADLSKEGYPWELILSSPDRDISGSLIYSDKLNDVVGIYYNDGEDKSIFFNEEFKKFQGGINKAIPNAGNYISNMSKDGRKYILYSSKEGMPSQIMFGDRDTKQLTLLATLSPELTEDILVKKEFLTYKARDGLEIGGYLSRPKNSKGKAIATIIYPHGGPMAEDGAEFDEFAAFFVNRGYAVFQPNFRGSSGRGFAFQMEAVGKYGLAMQDDLEDAVKFLVAEKITDANKVGIVGGSYGGYAALMGVTKTPDLFKCAVSLAGISDMKRLRESYRHFTNKNVAREQFGNDIDQLKRTSPVRMVENVKVPVLLIHGSDDTSVAVEQSRIMASELKSQKKVYEYIELEGGTHYFDYLPHRKQTFEAIEAFLAKYLPVQ